MSEAGNYATEKMKTDFITFDNEDTKQRRNSLRKTPIQRIASLTGGGIGSGNS